jgi:hypothetical protein
MEEQIGSFQPTEQMNNPQWAWYNFRMEDLEYLSETPSDFSDYIPQSLAAQNLYRLHQKTGKTALEAAVLVLEVVTSKAQA